MIALPLSIICSTYLVICFKYFERFNIVTLHAIVFNYILCVATGIMMAEDLPNLSIIHKAWFPVAATLGCLFFCIFNLMGYVARNVGVTMTSVAGKLSMVIPVSMAILFYDQPLTVAKVIAILLAVPAVIFTSERGKIDLSKGRSNQASSGNIPFANKKVFGVLLALLIFIGSGMNDSLVNYATEKLMREDEENQFNIVIFSFAAMLGIVVLLTRIIFRKEKVSLRAVVGGTVLGIPNYFSLLFLIEALNYPGWESSIIFPVNNMGVVLLTAAAAFLLFQERLSKINWLGMSIAIVSIALLIFS